MSKSARLPVVDDDESVTITLQAVLERDGYFVLTASSAAEVQGLLGKERFDVALVDLRLGDADGMDVVRRIRASQPGCEAIVLTGYASLESAVEAIRQGAYDYLVKPCDLDELRLTVKGAVERSMLAWIASKRLEDQDAAIREMQALVQELRRNLDRISSELAEIKLQLQQAHLRSR